MKYKLIILFTFIFITNLFSQSKSYVLSGLVSDVKNESLFGVTVIIDGANKGTITNNKGYFEIKGIDKDKCTIVVSSLGFKTIRREVVLSKQKENYFVFKLEINENNLDEVVVMSKSKATKIEETGFTVKSIETDKIKNQSVNLNSVLDKTPGIRVRTTGGIGSEVEYSLDGMTGNAIKFFIDGIPMDYYGSSYSINNIPISLIERIDIYKGVVPVELGSDALGGAINLVTNQKKSNYAEGSYSFGSFNTHQVALHGQWKFDSGFTTRLSTFYTTSDNNYEVWGEGVFYGEEGTGRTVYFTEENPTERFNDDFKTVSAKLDIGFTEKKWADQFFISLLASDQKQGVQTGQTMGHVYGEMRTNEEVLMPTLTYQKKDFITEGLKLGAFLGYSYRKAIRVDTTMNSYDWRGKIIGVNPSGGEIGRNSRSLYSLKDKSIISRINTTYQLPSNFSLGFNYFYSNTERTGDDPLADEYTIPLFSPQNIASHFAGLSLETIKFDDKLQTNIFIKKYGYKSSINKLIYTTEYETVVTKNNISNWGSGFAMSYKVLPKILLKASLEQATRLPTATEALGDGVTIKANDTIKPEQSFNVNLGITLGRYKIGKQHGIKTTLNTFYRSVSDKLQLNTSGGQETSNYINIRKVGGTGAEIDIVYDYRHDLRFNLNGTYLNITNQQKIDEDGNNNILFGDRLRNEPYFMANAGLEYTISNFIQKKSKIFTYLQSSYVHEFFLRWPSLAAEGGKDVVPTQLVFDAGISYTFPSEKLSIALDISNMLNEQVYDNFLLQKPGRAIFAKINFQL